MTEKTVFIYGPQGSGKTRNAEGLLKHFGLSTAVDLAELDRRRLPLFDHLVLCVEDPRDRVIPAGSRRVYSIDQALQLAGLASPPGCAA